MNNSSSLFSRQLIDVCKQSVAKDGGMNALAKLAFQRRQVLRRQAAERRGETVPSVLIASVTRRCNLDCAGCYAKRIRPEGESCGELSDDRFMELFEEASRLGVGAILVAGGEPLLRPDLLKRVAEMRGIVAPVFTNGTLLDDEAARLFGPESSLVPVFSIEGDEPLTSERRGSGVHDAVLAGIGRVRERSGIFGLSMTVTSRNVNLALSPDFLRTLAGLGAAAVFLVEYVPVEPGTEGLALEAEQRNRLNAPELGSDLPYPIIRLPGDEEEYGGCLAAGRGFAHLSPEGDLEACPFAPFSDTNASRSGLKVALASPLLASIRAHHGELIETKGGCALRDKGGWVAGLASCSARAAVGAA
jgi:MoaA/NifB/PqqE/SkfB family radical SAM enzyme